MTVIQALLIAAICLLLILYYKSFKNQAIKRLLFLFVFALGLVFVVFPELTNHIANLLGIGRGADLLLYFSVIGGFLALILIYSKFKELERSVAELVRRQAILHAKIPVDGTDLPSKEQPKDRFASGEKNSQKT